MLVHFYIRCLTFDRLLLCACYHKEVSDTFLSVMAIFHEILSLRSFSLWNDHKDIIKEYIYSYKKYRKAQATTALTTHLFIYYFFHFFPPLCCRVFLCRRQRNNNNNRARWQLSAMMASSWMWTGKSQTFINQMKLIKREHLFYDFLNNLQVQQQCVPLANSLRACPWSGALLTPPVARV